MTLKLGGPAQSMRGPSGARESGKSPIWHPERRSVSNSLRFLTPISIATALSLWCASIASAAPQSEKVDYNFQVRPILSDRCFFCHGPDPKQRKADLRLDSAEGAIAASKVIVPGKPNESELIHRITSTDPLERMPPPDSNLQLTPEEIDILRRWVAQGAEYKPHWAFSPLPKSVPEPAVKDRGWASNAIDVFVLAKLEKEGLVPSAPASKEEWIRRVTLDLTGLPPTIAETDAFLADESPESFARVADRLLASPRFGERLALEWLDVARYADSFGYQSDADMHVWPWRDWVIRALNANIPFDDFVTWQIAGDLLERPTRDQRLATTFCRLHRMTGEGGSIAEEWRNESVSDRVHTFGSAFLSLTFECSRCHDHKYDPITTRDYYSLGAFFNSIDEWGTYDNPRYRPTPTLKLPTAGEEKAIADHSAEVAALTARLAEVQSARESAFREWLTQPIKPAIPGLVAEFTLDELGEKNALANRVVDGKSGDTSAANTLVPGKYGNGLAFTGDDAANFPIPGASLDRGGEFTVCFWLQIPAETNQGIVFHRTSGTDTGFHGVELAFDAGRLQWALVRFWPGDAAAIRTVAPIAQKQWVHVAASYDGSGKAGGMRIFLDGIPAAIEVVRDRLTKNPEPGDSKLSFGERFRSIGLKGGMIDELRVYGRALTPVEVADIVDGTSLVDAFVRADVERLRPYYLFAIDGEVSAARLELRKARERLFAAENAVAEIMSMEEMSEPRRAYVLRRGEYDAPRDTPVERSTPAFFPPFPSDAPRNRLGLARWLTDPDHPLTARVAVNRYWQMLFGRGIVVSTENFGMQGALPTHPELLDWLSRDFVRSGWDIKRLLKSIVLSSTYRQRSAAPQELRKRDPDNHLLARGPSRRLPAEMLRDASLATGGMLVQGFGGAPAKPYQPPGLWKGQNGFLPEYVEDKGEGLYRRSLYTFWRRTSPPPNMLTFDAPSREVCVMRRQTTSTPLQPLVLLNDPQFVEAARSLGVRMLREGGTTPEERVTFAFRQTATRHPTPREIELLTELYGDQLERFRKNPEDAKKFLQIGDNNPFGDLDTIELAAAAAVAGAISNLDAAVTVR